MPSAPRLVLLALIAGLAVPSSAVAGDIYARVDEGGSVYFTDAPSPKQTKRYREPEGEPGAWAKVIEEPRPESEVEDERVAAGEIPTTRHVVPASATGFQGLQMQVVVRVNGRADLPFLLDTGAAVSSIPRAMLDRLGVRVDARTPRVPVRGFSGESHEVPIVTIAVVNVGGAQVERVPMIVSDDLEVGLLGMTFLRHFRVEVDSRGGWVTLIESDPAP